MGIFLVAQLCLKAEDGLIILLECCLQGKDDIFGLTRWVFSGVRDYLGASKDLAFEEFSLSLGQHSLQFLILGPVEIECITYGLGFFESDGEFHDLGLIVEFVGFHLLLLVLLLHLQLLTHQLVLLTVKVLLGVSEGATGMDSCLLGLVAAYCSL